MGDRIAPAGENFLRVSGETASINSEKMLRNSYRKSGTKTLAFTRCRAVAREMEIKDEDVRIVYPGMSAE